MVFSRLQGHCALSQDLLDPRGDNVRAQQRAESCLSKTGHLGQWCGHWRQPLPREVGAGRGRTQVTNFGVQSTGKGVLAFFIRERKMMRTERETFQFFLSDERLGLLRVR